MDGLTSNAILRAPHNSIYVCIDMSHVGYVRSLANHLQRDDLRIVPESWVAERHYLGMDIGTSVVVDHAVNDWSKEFSELNRRSRSFAND